MVASRELSLDKMIKIACSDQVLAGSLLRAANSAAFHRTKPATNVSHAAMFIGAEMTSRVLLTAAMKPLMAVPGLAMLWRHSVEAAQVAEAISLHLKTISPADAYVLGLLHDVGKLLLRLLPRDATESRDRLMRGGVPQSVAEVVTFGMEHAEAGAEVLRWWGLPHEYAAGIQFHHEPEHGDSEIAALLYLVEFWTAAEEDLPSTVRLDHTLNCLGITLQGIHDLTLVSSPLDVLM
jgi:putative nucleotidyltransferase with HDIG domain